MSSAGYCRPAPRSRRSTGRWLWNTWPTWLSPGRMAKPTAKYADGRLDSRTKSRSASVVDSWRKIAVRSNGTTRRSAPAMAANSASRPRFEINALLISSSVRYRSVSPVIPRILTPWYGRAMSEDFEYISRARLVYKDGFRNAYLGEVPEPVVYGVQGGLRQYYGVKEGAPVASTLDHIVAAVAG